MRFPFTFLAPKKQTAPEKESPQNALLWEAGSRSAPHADPDTQAQWQRLERSLLSTRSAASVEPVRARRVPALAFGLAAICIIAIAVYLYPRITTVQYETGRKEQKVVVLSDSTEIIMNHSSTLTVTHKLFDATRYVNLEGEAYFNVRRTGAPFVVTTSAATVTVLGTAFNVRIRETLLEVGVTRGRVNVAAHTVHADSAVVLGAGEATTCRTGAFPESPQKLQYADYPGWVHGKLFFYKTELTDVVREIEEEFDVRILMQDPALPAVRITGALAGTDPQTVIANLCSLTGKAFRHENENFIIY
jgi:ferric-dicitrate binding protein FerR (iron transport regulator)